MIDEFYLLSEEQKIKKIGKEDDRKKIFHINLSDKISAKKEVDKLVNFLYKKNFEDLANDYERITEVIRKVIFIGTAFAINPLLSIPVFIADRMIENKVNKKDAVKFLNKYEKEIKKIDKKMNDEKDADKKKALKSYKSHLEEGRDKIEQYRNAIHSDEEIEKLDSKRFSFDDDFDFDFDLEISEHCNIIMENVETILNQLNEETRIDLFTDRPFFAYITKNLSSSFKITFERIRNGSAITGKWSSSEKNELLKIIGKCKNKTDIHWVYIMYVELQSMLKGLIKRQKDKNIKKKHEEMLKWVDEVYYKTMIDKINELGFDDSEYLNEETTIKKIGRDIKHVDKRVSGKVDSTFDKIIGGIKKAVISDTREGIIKDSLPRLSKVIKAAIAFGATASLINPAIAIVGSITAMALNRKFTTQERKKVLHELKMELEIVEEKIRDADSSGNKKEKYQLMRLKNEINKNMEKIRYNIKD